MLTLCWSNAKEEGWGRYKTLEEVEERVLFLMENKNCQPEDLMVFGKDTCYLVPGEDGKLS